MGSNFLSELEKVYVHNLGSDLLKTVREKAWDHFLELGLPEKKDEAFRYIPLQKLYDASFKIPVRKDFEIEKYVYPEAQESYLVFVNGVFVKELSNLSKIPSKVVILSLLEAMRTYGSLLQSRWKKILKEETDPFAIFNLAAHGSGVFFYVPPGVRVESPVQCIFFNEGTFASSRMHLFLAAGSKMDCITTIMGDGVHNTHIDVSLEDNASFEQIDCPREGSGWHLNYFRAHLKKESQLRYLSITRGDRFTRHSLQTYLGGENGNALLQGLWSLEGSAQTHTHVKVEHAAPSAKSLQKFKGILNGTAQSSFEGKIYVHPEAQKTEAYQLNHNLLLSEGAIAQTKPNLEIFADDVKASHGATVSPIDEEQIFYLKSRGLSASAANHLLVKGFMQEMIDQIPFTGMRNGLSL